MQSSVQMKRAWLTLTMALALHVIDEALNDFLSVYNPIVGNLKQYVPWLPAPVFKYDVWLGGLIAAVIALLCLTTFVGESRRMARAAVVFAVLMMLNGTVHIVGSAYMGRWLPGVLSSPLLILCGAWLLVTALHALGHGRVAAHVA